MVIVASASIQEGISISDDPFRFLKRHSVYVVLCLLTMGAMVCIPVRHWYEKQMLLLGLAFLGLLAVLIVGTEVMARIAGYVLV